MGEGEGSTSSGSVSGDARAKIQSYGPTKLVIAKQLLCGGIAGCVAKTSIAPLERVKILFQVNSPNYPYTGVMSTLTRILTREGLNGLYKGNMSSIARVFPYAAIQFASFDFYKFLFTRSDQAISMTGNFWAGAMAGATAVVFTYPLDMTRARLAVQVHNTQYKGLLDALYVMWTKEGGIRALYRGMGPTMVGIFPYAGINFLSYDTLKYLYTSRKGAPEGDHSIPTLYRLAFGSFAGLIGQTVTYPLDVVRRRMQINGLRIDNVAFDYNYKNTLDGLITVYRREGFKMLYRGLHINYIKVVPLVSLSFTINDLLRSWMGISSSGGVSRH